MSTYRGMSAFFCLGLVCGLAGCVTQAQHDAIVRANLQLQDKLATSQGERAKARTQVALLRQEVLQARQAQQEGQDRLDGLARQIEVLQARIDMQAEIITRANKDTPQGQVTVSLSPDTLDKLIQRVQTLTEEVNQLRSQNTKLQFQLRQAAAQDPAAPPQAVNR